MAMHCGVEKKSLDGRKASNYWRQILALPWLRAIRNESAIDCECK